MMKRVLVIDLTLEDENERCSVDKKRSRPTAVCHVAVEKKVCNEEEEEEEQDEALVQELIWALRYAQEAHEQAQEQTQEPASSPAVSALSSAGSSSIWALNMYVPDLELSSNTGGDVFVAHKKRVLQELDALLCWSW